MSIVPQQERRAIGAYLRQQRQRSSPINHPALHRRRRHIDHLSQSDLAELAGVSESLVAQVENGRYDNLNPALLQKLADGLGLSPDQRQYLLNILQPLRIHPNGNPGSHTDAVPASVRSLVDATHPNPAVVTNPRLDVLYWNRAATRMIADFAMLPPELRNVATSMFRIPEMRTMWVDWEDNARILMGVLRMFGSLHPHYREAIHALAASLAGDDPHFREWWDSEEPGVRPNPEKDLRHPEFGHLRLYQTVSEVISSPHLALVVYTPRDEETARAFQEF